MRIHLVCDDHNVRKQLAKFQTVLIPVQRRKTSDLQDSGLIYDIGDGVALFTSELSVITRSDRDRGSRPFVEAQPGDHVMEEIRKMAGAFFVVQRDTV